MRQRKISGGYAQLFILVAAVIAIAVVAFILFNMHRSSAKTGAQTQTADLSKYCVSRTFAVGSSGRCVGDIQALTNYMENSDLTQCPFLGAATLPISNTYDAPTGAQIRAVQQWAVCYARQEGFATNVGPTGTVDKATWGELCTYSYTNPSRNGASGASAAITAGKDAGCMQLNRP